MRARTTIKSSVAFAILVGVAHAGELADRLAVDDPRALADAVTAIEHDARDPDDLYAAARACEDKLADPARALALYERILREYPDAKAAIAADKRGGHLREEAAGGHANEAAAFAALVRDAGSASGETIVVRGDALAAAPWPGAKAAELWLAEWLRHQKRFAEADARYAKLGDFPDARTGRVGAAIEARDYDRAETLLVEVPRATPEDRAVYADLVRALHRGRLGARLYLAAWICVLGAFAALGASLLDASLRGGWHRPRLRPPLEIWFLAPIAVLLSIITYATNSLVTPAVIAISAVGIVLAWLSGIALDQLRVRGRRYRLRSFGHVAICALGAIAVAYIAITRMELFDLMVETLIHGPET